MFDSFDFGLQLTQSLSKKDKKGLEICACRGVEEIKFCEKCSMLELDCSEFDLEDACAQHETECSGLVRYPRKPLNRNCRIIERRGLCSELSDKFGLAVYCFIIL